MGPLTLLAIAGARNAIDRVDDAMIALLAGRRAVVGTLARIKRGASLPVRDVRREQRVYQRSQRLAGRLGVPPDAAVRLMALLIAEACRQQSSPNAAPPPSPPLLSGNGIHMSSTTTNGAYPRLLRLLPPPRFWRRLLPLIPPPAQATMLEAVLEHSLSAPLESGLLDPIRHRRLGIEVSDLGLYWVLELRQGRLQVSREPAEANICGSATDLLLLASRLEDADTLFFQRKLTITGDTELGLTVRNLLDRLPWEEVPLGLRIALQRGSRLTRAARSSFHRDH
ncbi:ubiquinone anaerobic biosynthesis accessory factor UbiT [Pseudoxanthomonas wuyuanensis]|uniref:Ubiquinone biosynthesis accessory factor UbiT n=1 Tax=Pseudoxanthomonas wuyuanensis TaxID=1073196 RepID=A0A286CZ43_9GAMM|nr:SCP2 sterol-binding domain-containing protein [Pseudoxanthomonas wuyuanensis]KAF1722278.1 hypothetical protein CSC75_03320 [Pseudoxanthomonas wuyuanensis]SOD51668.1 Predicted lipid carrier protein YhbT, contains SCP2 domain [Pseudoxanthomonas wuyuanensis]